MWCSWWLVGLLALPLQVPRPGAGEEAGRELEAARRSILAREATDLRNWAEELSGMGAAQVAADVRSRLPRPVKPDGATRFVPLADMVPAQPASKSDARSPRLQEILRRSASELFELAKRAARSESPRYALASVCLREVLDRQPEHREARRLLGYVPYQGGWARPYAIQQIKEGFVDHPKFGWVKAGWVPHLDLSELPAPPSRGRVRWLPAAEADQLRSDWASRWHIFTEHFEIQTNVPLADAIGFGRRLEAFHDLFTSLLADVLGENLPLAQRFRNPKMTGELSVKRHLVYYFASKEGFTNYLMPTYGADITESLGFFDPPKASRGGAHPPIFTTIPMGNSRSRPTCTMRSRISSCSRRPGATPTPRTPATTGSSRGSVPISRRSSRSPTARSRSAGSSDAASKRRSKLWWTRSRESHSRSSLRSARSPS